MNDPITAALRKTTGLKLMTHVVAGYPDLETSAAIVETMAGAGADLIEIQLPFSDPTADGPAITRANHRALENGVRPGSVFPMIRVLSEAVDVPLLVMTYSNIPFRMGWGRFAETTAEAGAKGVIIPDLPLETADGQEALGEFRRRSLSLVPVLSPGMSDVRLRDIARQASSFLYLTLRVGTTGAAGRTEAEGLDFIRRVKGMTDRPLAAGFGIASPRRVKTLVGVADIAVIGSHLISVYESAGLRGLREFLAKCLTA